MLTKQQIIDAIRPIHSKFGTACTLHLLELAVASHMLNRNRIDTRIGTNWNRICNLIDSAARRLDFDSLPENANSQISDLYELVADEGILHVMSALGRVVEEDKLDAEFQFEYTKDNEASADDIAAAKDNARIATRSLRCLTTLTDRIDHIAQSFEL